MSNRSAGGIPHAWNLGMRRRGHLDEVIRQVVFDNQAEFLGQSAKFTLPAGYAVARPA